MATPFLGEIRMIPGNTVPRNWALCNGQMLPVSQYVALFSLLGTTYGGDGRVSFALPDLRSRVPMHFSSQVAQGTMGGAETVVLTTDELPAHNHAVMASSAASNTVSPAGTALAAPARRNLYDSVADTILSGETITNAGGDQAHENRQPYITVNFIIALSGIFPSRN